MGGWQRKRGQATNRWPDIASQATAGNRAVLKGEYTSWALSHSCLPDGTGPRDTDCSHQQRVGTSLVGPNCSLSCCPSLCPPFAFELAWTDFGILDHDSEPDLNQQPCLSFPPKRLSVWSIMNSLRYHVAHSQVVPTVEEGPGILSPEGSYSTYSPYLGQVLLLP